MTILGGGDKLKATVAAAIEPRILMRFIVLAS